MARGFAIAVVALCVLELAGPVNGVGESRVDIFGFSAMKGASAFGLILLGAALANLTRTAPLGGWRPASAVLGASAFSLGAATLIVYVTGSRTGIDALLPGAVAATMGDPQAGRMSATSAFCLSVAGLCVFSSSRPRIARLRSAISAALGASLVVVGCFNILGHATEGPGEFGWRSQAGMSLPVASGFTLFGLGILALIWSEGEFAWALDVRVSAGFAAGIVIMLAATGISYNYTNFLSNAAGSVTQAHEALRWVEESRTAIENLARSQRAFLQQREGSSLEPQDRELAVVRGALNHLGRTAEGGLISSNPWSRGSPNSSWVRPTPRPGLARRLHASGLRRAAATRFSRHATSYSVTSGRGNSRIWIIDNGIRNHLGKERFGCCPWESLSA